MEALFYLTEVREEFTGHLGELLEAITHGGVVGQRDFARQGRVISSSMASRRCCNSATHAAGT